MQTKHEEESPSRARFPSVTRNEREVLEFQTIGGGKNACIPWKWAVRKKILERKFLLKLERYCDIRRLCIKWV